MNEIYCSVAAKRMDCDNTVGTLAYTIQYNVIQESPANAKGTRDSSACMKAHCEQM